MSSRGTALPAPTRRLFPEAGSNDSLDLEIHAPYVLGRLLEDGDRRDLAWLVRTYGRERLVAWLQERGSRQLSHRSRVFWHLVLDLGAPANTNSNTDGNAAVRDALWPL